MRAFTADPYYKPTDKQLQVAGSLAREIRDRLRGLGDTSVSAHQLAKYYAIDTLRLALAELRAGRPVRFQ